MIRAFRKLKSSMRELNQVQENVEQTIKSLLQVPLLNGVLLTGITLTSGTLNRVEHKLGRKHRGYIIVSKNAAATIYETASSKTVDEGVLLLTTSTSLTASIWIF